MKLFLVTFTKHSPFQNVPK